MLECSLRTDEKDVLSRESDSAKCFLHPDVPHTQTTPSLYAVLSFYCVDIFRSRDTPAPSIFWSEFVGDCEEEAIH